MEQDRLSAAWDYWLYEAMGWARELGATDNTYMLWLCYNRGLVGGYANPWEGRV